MARITDEAVSAKLAEIVNAKDLAAADLIIDRVTSAMLARLADLTHAYEYAGRNERKAHVLQDAGWGF